ncbi:LOW QUALITY PROTEIN: protein CNGC15b-like [Juglans regia]|uniref:LOW QUALITY PROTEIN: protein CNGC15b-like n=1 Tax=Juglans regia TaxID=51240 RepID=A0A6P9ECK1_JUGRE|nr:LOW QUALITY PROTEIN: protein CNGC15b-like [Juglans regia]
MAYGNSRSVRFQDDLESSKLQEVIANGEYIKLKEKIDRTWMSEPSTRKKIITGKSLKAYKVLSRVFSGDYENVRKKILDPQGHTIRRWNKIFLVACLVSLSLDPLFFYLPVVRDKAVCIAIALHLEVGLTFIRSLTDIFYIIQIYIRFRTAYVAPSSRVFGRGELVIDSSKIALRYLRKGFCIDLMAALPLPQMLIWIVIPTLKGSTTRNTKNVLRFFIIFQYLPRLFLIFPLSSQIVKATGLMTETAWAGAAYNLMLYMLASHVLEACWYLLSIERQEACWRRVCNIERPYCQYGFLDCHRVADPHDRNYYWSKLSNVSNLCNPDNSFYQFGIYGDALISSVTSSSFFNKYFYCLWWGLKNLSSLGQNLSTSTYVGEIVFAIIVATLGLVLFGLLIGNMQTYLQSVTVRFEEWRSKKTDTEQWMHHRQLPPELRQSVRKYNEYKWVATRGVEEEALLRGLPMDLRRDIKRHLCLDLVRRVPLFDQMEERMLDAICERLKPALCTQGTFLVREGDPVNEMVFILRGHLDPFTTGGGRAGFFNSCRIGPGDFCGEELVTWALDASSSPVLPSSTRTIKAITEVEAFAIEAEDLKFVAAQYRKLRSKELKHKFRFYSQQWRTWAACFIQIAWRRYKKRKDAAAEVRDKQEDEKEKRLMEKESCENELSIKVHVH